MSTFNGKISHFPSISIDNFEGDENLSSSVFLLSHFHSDHMRGLWWYGFKGPLYVSPITEVFINKKYPHIQTVSIDIGETKRLDVDGGILVTPFPAYHCPGSVMFVLQTHEVTVLYTGDFRFQLKELEKITALSRFVFDEMYLDSTFLNEDFLEFPTQMESVAEVCRLCSEWLQNERHKVFIHLSANVGYEFLFIEIYKKLKLKVCVPQEEFRNYGHIPELDVATTRDQTARIHAGFRRNLAWQYDCTLFIRVSAMKWRKWEKGSPFKENKSNNHSVCYSNHSSLSEIRDFVAHLKPKKIFLNVIPQESNEIGIEEVLRRRKEMSKLVTNMIHSYTDFTDVPLKRHLSNCLERVEYPKETETEELHRREEEEEEEEPHRPILKRLNLGSRSRPKY